MSQLKRRIMECSVFSAPSVYTPPASPSVYPSDALASLSDDGSISSSEGSLTGSCSTLSDSDTDSDVDSGYESSEEQPKQQQYEPVNPVVQPTPNVQQRPAVHATFQPQPYVLPNQEYHGNPWGIAAKANPNPYLQSWGHPYEHQYESFHPVQQVQQPAVYHHAHPTYYPAPFQYGRDAW